MLNAISVDVEESFHATNFAPYVPRSSWDSQPSRVVPATQIVLDLFARHSTKGTFFVLGDVAKRHPDLVRRIVQEGHELASHGFNHQLVYDLTEKEFFADIRDSKSLLEDISGVRILGYRAPNFSIIDRTPWAHEQLINVGYVYDASLYPVYHPRYANPDKPRNPFKLETRGGTLFIFPAATASVKTASKDYRLPVAGGAYWRLLPLWFSRWGLKRINSKDLLPFVCYTHPWEFDREQERIPGPSAITTFRHYGGISSMERKVAKLLAEFRFGAIRDLATAYFPTADAALFTSEPTE